MLPQLSGIPLQSTEASSDSARNLNQLLPVGKNVSATVVAVSRDQVQPEIFKLKLEINNRLIQMGVFQALPVGQKININRQSDGQIQINPQPTQSGSAQKADGSSNQQQTNTAQQQVSSNARQNTLETSIKLQLPTSEASNKLPDAGRIIAAVISSRPIYPAATTIQVQNQTPTQIQNPQQGQVPTQPQNTQQSQVQTQPQNPQQSQVQTQPQNPQQIQVQTQPQNTQRSQVQTQPQNTQRSQVQTQPQNTQQSQVQTQPQNPQQSQVQIQPQNPPQSQVQTQTQNTQQIPVQTQPQNLQQSQVQTQPQNPQQNQVQTQPQNPAQTQPQNPQQSQPQTQTQNPQQSQIQTQPQNTQQSPIQTQAQTQPQNLQQSPAQTQPQNLQQSPTQTQPQNPQQSPTQTQPQNSQQSQIQAQPQNPQQSQAQTQPQNTQQSQAQTQPQNTQQSQVQSQPQNTQQSQVQTQPQNPQQSQVQTQPQNPQQSQVQSPTQNPQQVQIQTQSQNPQQSQAPIQAQNTQQSQTPIQPQNTQQSQVQSPPQNPQQGQPQPPQQQSPQNQAASNQPVNFRPSTPPIHHSITLALPNGSKIEVNSPQPLPQGTQVLMQKTAGSEAQIIKLQTPPLQQSSALEKPAIQETLRNSLPNQVPVADAFSQLAQAAARAEGTQAAQISTVVRSMLQLFGVRPGSSDAPTQIKQNIELGGFNTERNLSKGQAPNPQDMKSQLQQLQNMADKLPEEQRERFEQLLRGLHSRVTSQQLGSLQQWRELPDGGFERVLQLDLPIKQGDKWENLELRLSREGGSNAAGEMVSVWRVRLHFDLEEQGGVDAEIRLTDDHEISTLFWCDQPETADKLRARSEEFAERLRNCGFSNSEVQWHQGTAPEQKQTIHKQLVDLHT